MQRKSYESLKRCILRSLADIDAFQSGRFAEQNGRSKTLKYQVNLAVESLLYSAL